MAKLIAPIIACLLLIASTGLIASTRASAQDSHVFGQNNIDRRGQDIANFDLNPGPGGGFNPRPGGDDDFYGQCSGACQGHAHCMAFTYVRPGVQGAKARCWLKGAVPPPLGDACCISGLSPRAWRAGHYEDGVDRPGGDFANFDLAAPQPSACDALCKSHSCISWTYVKPGVQGPGARCWLKNAVMPARLDNCCTSSPFGYPPPVR